MILSNWLNCYFLGPPLNNNFMMGPVNNMYPKPMPVSAGKVYPANQPMVSASNSNIYTYIQVSV